MKPILFNTEMVRAILDGRKTVTRRLVKPKPGKLLHVTEITPPYKAGDILYVRETWQECPDLFGEFPRFIYRANYSEDQLTQEGTTEELETDFPACVPWKPSIHMPKEAARIFLKVKSVRVERLQDITADECPMEGVPLFSGLVGDREKSYKTAFATLWDSTIKLADLPAYGWEANHWVWVIRFERIEKEEAERVE